MSFAQVWYAQTLTCAVFCYINNTLALSVILCNEFEIVQEVQYGPR